MRPFSCGSQFGDWEASNCDRCAKSRSPECAILKEIIAAYWGDGEVCVPIAERMGAIKYDGYFLWVCPEAVFKDPNVAEAAWAWVEADKANKRIHRDADG